MIGFSETVKCKSCGDEYDVSWQDEKERGQVNDYLIGLGWRLLESEDGTLATFCTFCHDHHTDVDISEIVWWRSG